MAELLLSEWQTESLRLSAFLQDPIPLDDLAGWSNLIGHDPEVSQLRPHEGSLHEAGSWGNGWLTFAADATRIDWRAGINPNEPLPSGWPVIGSFEPVRDRFKALMKKWLKNSPRLNRLAFGAILVVPVADRVQGYRLLDNLLPSVKIDAQKTSDLSYRINRRRLSKSGIKKLEINRLSTWTVGRITGVTFNIAAHTPSQSRAIQTGTPVHACRLELDINTALEFKSGLKKTALSKLLDEVIELGNEIATKGDIP